MKWILSHLLKYKGWVLVDFLSVFGFALAELGIPTIISNMIDSGIEKGNAAFLYSQFWLIVGIAVLGTCGTILLSYVSNRISTSVGYDIRQELFHHALQLSNAQMETFGVSSMITRTGADPYSIMMFLNTILRSALMAPVMLITSIILIVRISIPLSMVVLATIPAIVIGVIVIAKVSGKLSENQQKSLDSINEILRENLSGIRVIRSFGQEEWEEERFARENQYYRTQSTKLFKLMNVSEPLFFCLMNMATLIIYYMAAIMIGKNTLQIGQLVAFVEYLFHCMMSVLVFCLVFMMYPRAAVSAKRIQAVLNTKPDITNRDQPLPLEGIESLEFDHVDFVYPQSEEAVLKDISFSAKAGQKIAVIGSTGSGKTTLVKLIARFYDVSKGQIKINGINIQDYDLLDVRKHMGYVTQKAHLFAQSIKDNIAFGLESASTAEVEEAARIAQSWDFIQKRENGLEDLISEEGTNLSGGQKQRISIARALIKHPDLYIYDDSFSALDFRTDAALRKALAPVVKNAIFLVVAQRVSTILDADCILVLDEGRLAGMGRHEELMQTCEIYREIVLSQMSEKEAMSYAG